VKTAAEVSSDKLRGGFYSPASLVDLCLDRVAALVGGRTGLELFEPSAGDGAFIRGIARHRLRPHVAAVTAVEINPNEAHKCSAAAGDALIPARVLTGSVLSSVRASLGLYDVAVGNPPFVRFQFVSDEDRRGARLVEEDAGCVLAGVSNLWIPVFLTALTRLRDGGAFAFVVPAECFTGISARVVRSWLLSNCANLQADLFPVGSFPGALQEVIVLSGTRGRGDQKLRVVEHFGATLRAWEHHIAENVETWTRFLLTPGEVAAFDDAKLLPDVSPLGDLARFTVATVTGANNYFSLSHQSVTDYGLRRWVRPLLPRIRHAEGLIFSGEDHAALLAAEERGWMLDFRAHHTDPLASPGPSSYIRAGELDELHLRYKTRIRKPWFQVPVVAPGQMLLSKRSNRFARMVLNDAAVVTTDTIYQGSIRPGSNVEARDLVASFHNSLTLLSTEIEGRSFGGGVLEVVPSEIARLVVAVPPRFGDELDRLDAIARNSGSDSENLVDETDRMLGKYLTGSTPGLLDTLRRAYESLRSRRLARSGG
jgi:hypothetical protein